MNPKKLVSKKRYRELISISNSKSIYDPLSKLKVETEMDAIS